MSESTTKTTRGTPTLQSTPLKTNTEPLSGTVIPETPQPSQQRQENEYDEKLVFAPSETTPRTPPQARNSFTNAAMAPKKDKQQNKGIQKERPATPTPTNQQKPPTEDVHNEDTLYAIITIIREAREEIIGMNTSGKNKDIKAAVIGKLTNATQRCTQLQRKLDNSKHNQRTTENINDNHEPEANDIEGRFRKLETDMTEIKGNMAEIKEMMLGASKAHNHTTTERMSNDLDHIKRLLAKPSSTFAQIVATEPPTPNTHGTPTNKPKPNTNNKEKMKKQREKLTITITAATAPDSTKNQLKTMHAKDLIQKCQSAIAENCKEGHVPKIHGINMLSDDAYRIHCESEDDPPLLSKMDWNKVFQGVKVRQRKYGVVVHGVRKSDLDPTNKEQEDTKNEIEEENSSRNLHIQDIAPLRRTQKHLNKIAAHHSIVIFTHSIEEADNCLKNGMFIKGKYYQTEKYTPELNVTQCFKCYGFRHLAKHCKNEQMCGNCGQKDHETPHCSNETKCAGCGKAHPAWHIECSKRDEEGNRLKALKLATTDFYSE